MIPRTGISKDEFFNKIEERNKMPYNSKDYKVENGRIVGYIKDIDSIMQTVVSILSIEKGKFTTFSNQSGFKSTDIFGTDDDLKEITIRNRILESLLADDRIKSVDVELEKIDRNSYHAILKIETVIGNVDKVKVGVNINE